MLDEVRIFGYLGPSRLWSAEKTPACRMPLDSGGYAGRYVCQSCSKPCNGVYRVQQPLNSSSSEDKWLCSDCKHQWNQSLRAVPKTP
jgi:hypothetical protein